MRMRSPEGASGSNKNRVKVGKAFVAFACALVFMLTPSQSFAATQTEYRTEGGERVGYQKITVDGTVFKDVSGDLGGDLTKDNEAKLASKIIGQWSPVAVDVFDADTSVWGLRNAPTYINSMALDFARSFKHTGNETDRKIDLKPWTDSSKKPTDGSLLQHGDIHQQIQYPGRPSGLLQQLRRRGIRRDPVARHLGEQEGAEEDRLQGLRDEGRKEILRQDQPHAPRLHGKGTKNYTNARSVTIKNVRKGKVSLKKGGTFKIKAKVKKVRKNRKLMPKSHAAKLRYMSSDSRIATVSAGGRITAKGKGTCTIVAFAHNGVSRSIKVVVK